MDNKEEFKSHLWVLTVNEGLSHMLPGENRMIRFFEEICEFYVFQEESGEETGREHYQCALRLKSRKRKSTLLKLVEKSFPGMTYMFQFDRMYGTFNEAIEYCTKTETRTNAPISNLPIYQGMDVDILDDVYQRYPWQAALFEELFISGSLRFKTPDDRKIYWITDPIGNSGKSKFTKYVVIRSTASIKVPFGTATQMRSAIINEGPCNLYIIDIPRTLAKDDDMHAVYSLIEDLKNGFVVSSMYGKNAKLIMNPPHVIVFSNMPCPRQALSADRWIEYKICDKQLIPQGVLQRPKHWEALYD